jgi:predicted metalloprotease
LTRDTILKLLSEEQVARISTAETMPALSDGAEYLDLENFDRGVQHADASTKFTTGYVLAAQVPHAGNLGQSDRSTGSLSAYRMMQLGSRTPS